ncbi:MAG TPA: multiheme c-type cytochrome [Methylophilaceae bacterium]|nr:multiheme c-type cytochrome [Methylophilaceae bacterium]
MRRIQLGGARILGMNICKMVLLCVGLSLANSAFAVMPNLSHDQTVGSVNCANSFCHGSITHWDDSNVLQNEYTTWERLDQHTKAYNVLLNKQSKLIAKNLGLKKPAHESKVCLDCHAHNPPSEQRGERFIMSEGIGCEGCHGPAGRWIKSHTLASASHANNIENGLYPTDSPVAQAKLCLSCHFGDQNRFITHRIMGAGHPRISFELETFTAIQPAHFRIDDDWHKRKGDYNPVKVWAIGQVIASQQLLNAFTDPKLGRDGIFPELVLFDCHACHHPMSQQKWTPRLGVGPGRIRLNDSNLLMLRAIVRVVDSNRAVEFNKRIMQMHQAVSGDGDPSGLSPIESAQKVSSSLDAYVTIIKNQEFGLPQLKQVYLALIDEAIDGQFSDYAGAEQAYMAISNLSLSLAKMGGLKSAADVNRQLANMRKTLSNDEQYQPKILARQLADLKYTVSQSR